jgi:integrase
VSNAYGKAAWRKACKRVGLAGLRFHDPRHTWASWLMQADVKRDLHQ